MYSFRKACSIGKAESFYFASSIFSFLYKAKQSHLQLLSWSVYLDKYLLLYQLSQLYTTIL